MKGKKENGPGLNENEALHEVLLQAEPALDAGALCYVLEELQVCRDDLKKYCFEGAALC